ncbi:hypothetical protein FP74_gp168 [Bacillus phage CAM003]|uniref:Uncharacterized protein n=2 Tax=Bastillevirus CAM003 TaxID=1918012 RepID=A0A024B0X6_9CAUD|nr:hypothetical protein FP74_gp168 [Bacillus phage CAM003]AHZ09628.1 hypothetical protein [Bacillus phage CAM003]ASU01044.1 hypothetical protein ANTHONY_204 [Bacillus phage Anthony]
MTTDIREAVVEDREIKSKYKIKFGDSPSQAEMGEDFIELMRKPTAEEVQTILDLHGASMCIVEEITSDARMYRYNDGWN